jgi:hypothetical protein
MRMFIAGLIEQDYCEVVSFNIGIYSSKELAEKALLAKLREEEEVSSLEEYDKNPKRLYDWFIEEWEVDK